MKCQQLQSKYRDLKTRAEQAISSLINTRDASPAAIDAAAAARLTSPSRNNNNRNITLQAFGTPRRSRLSVEQQHELHVSRRSLGGADDAAATTATSSTSGTSTAEFLRYHQGALGGVNEQYRGPDYWTRRVRQNEDDLTQPLTQQPLMQQPRDDETLRERILRESDARIVVSRTIQR